MYCFLIFSTAVVLEKGFFNDEKLYENTVSKISETMHSVIRECMELGGIEVKVYADTRVNLRRGKMLALICNYILNNK